MRKIVNDTMMTLDGDISNMQDWHFDFIGDEFMAAARERLFGADAVIMGRETYEGFAPAWSERAGSDDYADRMNAIQKYVVSTALTDPDWNNTDVISGDVAAEVTALKEQDGQDIVQYGFGDVTRLLLDNGLLDELRVWLHPVLSGKAESSELIHRNGEQYNFELTDTAAHGTGLMLLTYTPKAG